VIFNNFENYLPYMFSTVLGTALVVGAIVGLGTIPARYLEKYCGPYGVLALPLCLTGGWSIISFFSAFFSLWDIHQATPSWALMILGILSLLINRQIVIKNLFIALLLALPLAIFTSIMPTVMFDDFSHWLPNTRFLTNHDLYWSSSEIAATSDHPSYPNGTVVISLLIARLVGVGAMEAAFRTFMVFCIVIFGFLLTAARKGPKAALPAILGFTLLALLDPFFDPRIALTSYADAPTGIVLAIAGLSAAAGLSRINRGITASSLAWFAWTGIACSNLVMLRATNVILVAAIALSVLIFLPKRKTYGLYAIGLITVPAACSFAVWQAHLLAAGIGPELQPRPLLEWDWNAPITVLHSLFIDRLLNNVSIAIAAVVLGFAGFCVLIVSSKRYGQADMGVADAGPVIKMATVVSACFVLFLSWTYIAVFAPEEVARAGSAWRYLSELGPLITLAVIVGIPPLPRLIKNRGIIYLMAAAFAITILFSPVWGHSYYGVACRYDDVIAARKIATDLRPVLLRYSPADKAPRLAITHPTMATWFAAMTAYEFNWPIAGQRAIAVRMEESSADATELWAWDAGVDALLDLATLDRTAITASSTIPAITLRGRPVERGEPWPDIITLPSQALPLPCGQ
jgi:hypothetical protein